MSATESKTRRRRKASVKVNEDWCKGCRICVEFCPKQVFEMESLKAVVRDESACILCYQCEMLCPDFAIEVNEVEDKNKDEAA
jgi:2-oxoglutarate ferredoxin oxidoreductase subunit delta